MNQRSSLHIISVLTLLLFGLLGLDLKICFAQQDEQQVAQSASNTVKRQNLENTSGLVEVEPTNIVPADLTGGFYLIPYRIRRPRWTQIYGLAYSTFSPIDHEPEFVATTYEEVFGSDGSMFDFTINIKRNLRWGSLGFEVGAGSFSKSSVGDFAGIDLSITPIRLGFMVSLDNLFFEPYVVPYVVGGGYTIIYKESIGTANDVSGNTQVAPYATAGILFQTDWLDKTAARESYQESGIENTFVFVEGRMFFEAMDSQDPNFSSFHANLGLKIEL
jgi:hypothetical protein